MGFLIPRGLWKPSFLSLQSWGQGVVTGPVFLPPPHVSQSHASSILRKSFPDRGFTASFWGVFYLCGQLKSLLEWENSLGSGMRKRVKEDNYLASSYGRKLIQQVFIACLHWARPCVGFWKYCREQAGRPYPDGAGGKGLGGKKRPWEDWSMQCYHSLNYEVLQRLLLSPNIPRRLKDRNCVLAPSNQAISICWTEIWSGTEQDTLTLKITF